MSLPKYTLRDLIADAQKHLAEHPEDGELSIVVPYDSQLAETSVYGGFTRIDGDDPYLILDGDS